MATEPRVEEMSGLAKGLAIIQAFRTRDSLTVADAARAANSSRAAARRCLLTLQTLKYVELVGRDFRPLPPLRKLGTRADQSENLAELAQPLLLTARNELGESVSLAVLEDGQCLFVARAEADHIISIGVRIGAYLPAYCSATGRVLLSALSDKQVTQTLSQQILPSRTPHTLTKLSQVMAAIRQARELGFAISDEEIEIGMRSLAVPVFGPTGAIVAAMSVSSASARARVLDLKRKFLPVLVRSSAQLTNKLL
jgi:IclR family pca regulon transcriptional regulator